MEGKKEKALKPKKPRAPKKASTHPKYHVMVREAIVALKERRGSSRQAILNYIVKKYEVGLNKKLVNVHLKLSLRAGVRSGHLKQTRGSGASGSFKLADKPTKPRKKRTTKPKSDKPKKVRAKKPKKEKKDKKDKKEKSPKKPKKPKSPKRERKPKSPKRERKPKSPKKARKPKSPKRSQKKKSPKGKKASA